MRISLIVGRRLKFVLFRRFLLTSVVPNDALKKGGGIWQRLFWEHVIRNERDYVAYIDYCQWNPVKHGYAKRVIDWPFSSFHRYVRNGILTEGWVAGWKIWIWISQKILKLLSSHGSRSLSASSDTDVMNF